MDEGEEHMPPKRQRQPQRSETESIRSSPKRTASDASLDVDTEAPHKRIKPRKMSVTSTWTEAVQKSGQESPEALLGMN